MISISEGILIFYTKKPHFNEVRLTYRENRIRTCDPLVPNQVLYQTEPFPVMCALKDLNLQPSDS